MGKPLTRVSKGPLGPSARLVGLILIVSSCQSTSEKPVLEGRSLAAASSPTICFDGLGHRTGAAPWILGGTCCCNPSLEIVADYEKHRHWFGTLEELKALYEDHHIATIEDHTDCNSYCKFGPHLARGGHCLVPPTPGTPNYEALLTIRRD